MSLISMETRRQAAAAKTTSAAGNPKSNTTSNCKSRDQTSDPNLPSGSIKLPIEKEQNGCQTSPARYILEGVVEQNQPDAANVLRGNNTDVVGQPNAGEVLQEGSNGVYERTNQDEAIPPPTSTSGGGNGTTEKEGSGKERDPAAAWNDGPPGSSVSAEDIQLVQNLIERCLQMYMAQEEVIKILKTQASIDPEFTKLVWKKLEEQNAEFFRCYYTRLKLKAQIIMFNHLLEQQVSVVQRMQHGFGGHIHSPGAHNIPGNAAGSSTTSGIPLFQGNEAKPLSFGGPQENHFVDGSFGAAGGQTNVAGMSTSMPSAQNNLAEPRTSEGIQDHAASRGGAHDFSFNLSSPIDGMGSTPLFTSLTHVDSGHDLNALGGTMPTPGLLPSSSSGLNLPTGSAPQQSLPRNYSLSDLGMDGSSPSMRRNFSLDGLSDAPVDMNGTKAERSGRP